MPSVKAYFKITRASRFEEGSKEVIPTNIVDKGETNGNPNEAKDSAKSLPEDVKHHREVSVYMDSHKSVEAQHKERS